MQSAQGRSLLDPMKVSEVGNSLCMTAAAEYLSARPFDVLRRLQETQRGVSNPADAQESLGRLEMRHPYFRAGSR